MVLLSMSKGKVGSWILSILTSRCLWNLKRNRLLHFCVWSSQAIAGRGWRFGIYLPYLVAVIASGWDHTGRVQEKRCWIPREYWCVGKKRSKKRLKGCWEGETREVKRKAVNTDITESQEKRVSSRERVFPASYCSEKPHETRSKNVFLWFSNSDSGEGGLTENSLARGKIEVSWKGNKKEENANTGLKTPLSNSLTVRRKKKGDT